MSSKYDFKRVYSALSDRVKSTDIHPNEPWLLVGLYNGQVNIHNHESNTIIKSFDIGQVPVRSVAFITRKNWIVCASDDLYIRCFNYNTLEKIHNFEAHTDYIRNIIVHPTKSYIISCSDDMLIKVWDFEKRWECIQIFEGHHHYVMQIAINPKDQNQIASASLDKKIKIWQLSGFSKANFTLEGHEKGVNSVDYCHSADKPYLVSSADDWNIKIWDYQNKSCIHTLTGHMNNVIRVIFHPILPFIISASEDGSVRLWNTSTFKSELILNYGMGRVWSISVKKESNEVALGYDDGVIFLRAGKESPTCCMDLNGKIFKVKQNNILYSNIKNIESELKDCDKYNFSFNELGTSEIFPQTLICSPNGRYIAVVGDGEFIVYTTIALRSKIFGTGDRFVWCNDSNCFASRENLNIILYKNFKEYKKSKLDYTPDDIFGGILLGIRSSNDLYFYEWSQFNLIIKINVSAINIYWNNNSSLCCICETNTIHILKYNSNIVEHFIDSNEFPEFGIIDAFESIFDLNENIITGLWINDCFIFTNKSNRLCYLISDQLITLSPIDKFHYILGFYQNINRLFLSDKDGNITSYGIEIELIEYQIAIINKNFTLAEKILPNLSVKCLNQLSFFLENQNLYSLALSISPDLNHKFDLAIRLKQLDVAYDLALKLDNHNLWKILAKISITMCQFDIALKCYRIIKDIPALFLLAFSLNSRDILDEVLKLSIEQKNIYVSFIIYYITGNINEAIQLLKNNHLESESAIMSYCYAPHLLEDTFNNWNNVLKVSHPKEAEKLADPFKYPNLFPHLVHSNDVCDKDA